MYVRSWSYWAPANIGPYSQAVKVRYWTIPDFFFYAAEFVPSSNLSFFYHFPKRLSHSQDLSLHFYRPGWKLPFHGRSDWS